MKTFRLKSMNRPKYVFMLVFVSLFMAGAWFYDIMDSAYLNYAIKREAPRPQGEISIIIRISDRVLELYDNGKIFKRYRVATGKAATPTPYGEWTIVYKGYSQEEVLGTRWMGLDVPWGSYGIHGTSMPWSIGSFASKGCIRMLNQDAEELYEWVPVGTSVKIIGQRKRVQQVLRRGNIGPGVVTLQLKLIELGYYFDKANGRFNKETEAAVRAYQRDKGISENGVVDRQLAKMLGI